MQGGGSQPSAPTLDIGQSRQLTEEQLKLQKQYIPIISRTAGQTSLGETSRNLAYGLQLLTNPSAAIYGPQIDAANSGAAQSRQGLGALRSGLRQGKMFDQVSAALGDNIKLLAPRNLTQDERKRIESRIKTLEAQAKQGSQRAKNLQGTDIEAQIRRALPTEYANRDAFMREMGASMEQSPEYGRYQQQLADGGELGKRLMGEAMQRSERGFGVLSAQAERDATQQTRSAMAARGMATGSAGIGAELLNRDRYQRARAAEDINFVGGVMNDQTSRLGQSAGLADQERARQLSTRQNMYNFALQTNPRLLAAGLGSPYANMTAPSMQMVGSANGLQPMYSGGQFSSSGGGMGGNMGMAAGGALTGAATGAMMGAAAGGVGAIPGAIIGGLAGGASGYLSDKRTKTDIKPLGKVTSLLDLPAYEYRYKGEKKKR